MQDRLAEVLNGLLDEGAFLEVEATVAAEYPAQTAVRVGVLCDVARRVANLDAEDFAELAGYPGIPTGVADVLSRSSWPRTRTGEPRGALTRQQSNVAVALSSCAVFVQSPAGGVGFRSVPGLAELFSAVAVAVAGDAGPVVVTGVMPQLRDAVRGVLGILPESSPSFATHA